MNSIKKLFVISFALAAFFISGSAQAAADKIIITFKDGSVKVFSLSDIDNIRFDADTVGGVTTESHPVTAKATLEKIINMYEEGNYNEVFEYIGNQKCTGTMTDKERQKYGDEIMRTVKKFAKRDLKYGDVKVEFEKEGQWNAIPVTYNNRDDFTDEIREETATLAFLQVSNRWLLCDVDY